MQGQTVIFHDADSGMDLVRAVARLIVPLGGHGLCEVDTGFQPIICEPVRVQFPQCLECGPSSGVQVVDDVHDVVLHPLEPTDGIAELDAGSRVLQRHVENRLRSANLVGAQDGNCLLKCPLEGLPGRPRLSQHGVG